MDVKYCANRPSHHYLDADFSCPLCSECYIPLRRQRPRRFADGRVRKLRTRRLSSVRPESQLACKTIGEKAKATNTWSTLEVIR